MDKEIEFIQTLEDLIETFSNSQLPVNKQSADNRNPLENLMALMRQGQEMSATGADQVYEYPDAKKLDRRFGAFIQHIETTSFHLDIIPYDKITECVFNKTPPEMLNKFTDELRNRGKEHFVNSTPPESSSHEINFLKIMRHIDLALVQKDSFTKIKLKEMDTLKHNYRELDIRYTNLKDEADRQYKNMLTQFISILGIFAAILMGAFGAIQGFTNLFDNAKDLPIGKLLIISSIGASSVILILFFLLNAIAKLTERSLSSIGKKKGTWHEKYPSLVIIHAILILIVFIGASLELSNISLQFAWQGFWWLFPISWLLYIVLATYKKDPFFLFNSLIQWIVKQRNKNVETQTSEVEQQNNSNGPNDNQQS